MLAENFVETAIDFLVVQNEAPATALRIVLSAELRSYRIPFGLVRAYAWDLARDHPGLSLFKAYRVIVDAERGYRDLVRLYGGILMQDESTAFNLLVAQGVGLAEAFLKARTGEHVPVPPELLAEFFQLAIINVESNYADAVMDALDELD